VTVGTDTVLVTTAPGYSNLVAVTSIWHWLEHEIDAGVVEDELGVNVCTIVVGCTWVVTNDCVIRIVDTETVARKVTVDTEVEPGREIVLKTVDPGKVTVASWVVVETLPGNWLITVEVTAGRVTVERMVLAGSWLVTMEVSPGNWIVEVTTSPGSVTVETTVLAGSWVVITDVVPGSWTVDVVIARQRQCWNYGTRGKLSRDYGSSSWELNCGSNNIAW
jgi:nitrogen fixation protein FixH